jgi:hypothetical protein
MKNLVVPIIAGLILMIPLGCENWGTDDDISRVVGTGPIISKTLDLNDFNKIDLTGVADIYVTIGNPQSVVLKAQQNIIDVMTIGVLSNELKVGLKEGYNIQEADTIRFDITIPEISAITLTGVGDFVLSGDYQEELTISLTGVGKVSAFDLEVGTCNITITGLGDCEVNVKNELNVDISGIGDIYYKGNPNTGQQTISGVGRLIDAN